MTFDEIFLATFLAIGLAYVIAVVHPLLTLSALITWAAL